jgi:putative glutamine amidotransferase
MTAASAVSRVISRHAASKQDATSREGGRFTALQMSRTLRIMPRPVIGITMDYGDKPRQYMLPYDYTTSIERAGGLPWPLPYMTDRSLIPEIVDRLDGIVFSGGDDLDPALYGETRHPQAEPIDPDRQRFELALIAEVERRRMPALGICLGCQLMNVHRGGSLIQFLPDGERDAKLEHRKMNDTSRRHPVRLEPGTPLADAVGGTEIAVNTRHKQAIGRPGKGLRVIATAPDGVVEGIEDPNHPFFMAVQWHPENLSDRPEHLAPFKLLVNSATSARQSPPQKTDK